MIILPGPQLKEPSKKKRSCSLLRKRRSTRTVAFFALQQKTLALLKIVNLLSFEFAPAKALVAARTLVQLWISGCATFRCTFHTKHFLHLGFFVVSCHINGAECRCAFAPATSGTRVTHTVEDVTEPNRTRYAVSDCAAPPHTPPQPIAKLFSCNACSCQNDD